MKASTFFTVSFNIINVPKYINFFNNVYKCDKKTVVFFYSNGKIEVYIYRRIDTIFIISQRVCCW